MFLDECNSHQVEKDQAPFWKACFRIMLNIDYSLHRALAGIKCPPKHDAKYIAVNMAGSASTAIYTSQGSVHEYPDYWCLPWHNIACLVLR